MHILRMKVPARAVITKKHGTTGIYDIGISILGHEFHLEASAGYFSEGGCNPEYDGLDQFKNDVLEAYEADLRGKEAVTVVARTKMQIKAIITKKNDLLIEDEEMCLDEDDKIGDVIGAEYGIHITVIGHPYRHTEKTLAEFHEEAEVRIEPGGGGLVYEGHSKFENEILRIYGGRINGGE